LIIHDSAIVSIGMQSVDETLSSEIETSFFWNRDRKFDMGLGSIKTGT